MTTINCEQCRNDFDHPLQRGRRPKRCPDCREKPDKTVALVKTKMNAQERIDQLELMLRSRNVHISQHDG